MTPGCADQVCVDRGCFFEFYPLQSIPGQCLHSRSIRKKSKFPDLLLLNLTANRKNIQSPAYKCKIVENVTNDIKFWEVCRVNMGKVELLRDEVVGLRPVYTQMGNCTELLLKNGEIVLDRRVIHSVMKALAASYAVDLKAQRHNLQSQISRKAVLPFYLGDSRVFVPLKMRQPLTENDAVYGYIDQAYMTEPQKGSGRACLMELSNGIKLQILSAPATIHNALHAGLSALDLFQPPDRDHAVEAMLLEIIRLILHEFSRRASQLDRIESRLPQDNADALT